jgi:hypothetical protein
MHQEYKLPALLARNLHSPSICISCAGAIELWLLKAPGGAISFSDSDPRAEPTVELLADAWGSGLAHTMAAGPVDKQELVAGCERSPRSTKRLLARLHRAGMVEAATTPAGVTFRVGEGRVLAGERELDPWFTALIDGRPKRLRFEGDRRLARALVAACGAALFDEAAYAH